MINWKAGLTALATAAAAHAAQFDASSPEPPAPSYIAGLFPEQRAFVDDRSKKKAALCGRRSGKTEGVAAWLIQGGMECPGGLSLYIARSRANARLILWNTLQRIERRHNIGLRFREIDQQLMVELPNEHRIWLAGCKDRSEMDKFRGIGGVAGAGLKRVAVDEAQSFPEWFTELIEEVLEPTLLDQDGDMAIVGTPAPIPAGLFYEATTGDGGPKWSTHHWNVLDNPHIKHAGRWLEEKRQRNGWNDQHPTYRREWLGQWVLDRGALVYPFDSAINTFTELPPESKWSFALGIDLGYSDEQNTAFVVAAYRKGHPEIYVLECELFGKMIPSRIAALIQQWDARYKKDHGAGFSIVVADEGGLGEMIVDEMRQSFGLAIERAEKTKKRAYIEMVAGDLQSGTIKIHPYEARELINELQVLPWDEEREAPDERFQDHAADAFLYVCRAVRPWYRPEREPPTPGSPEWYAAEQKKWRDAAAKKVRENLRRKWNPGRRRALAA